MDNYDSEEERVNNFKQKKTTSMQLKKLQQVSSFLGCSPFNLVLPVTVKTYNNLEVWPIHYPKRK